MNGMKWFRVYSEIKDDPKILEMDDHQRWLWICLLAMASESTDRGTITNVRLRGLAASLRTDEARLLDTLQLLADLEMIDYDEDARMIAITHWDDRQYDKPSNSPSATRDRKRKSRESHADVTPCHAIEENRIEESREDTEILTAYAVSAPDEPPAPEPAPKPKRTATKKPADANMQHPAVVAFRDVAQKFPNHVQAQAIATTVTDVPLWQDTVKQWLTLGWSPVNIDGMLARYTGGWADIDAKRNGQQRQEEREPAYKRAIRAFIQQEGLAPNGI